jgi:hypothetical protein
LTFTNTTPTVQITVTNIVGNSTQCPEIDVTTKFDSSNQTFYFPVSNGRPVPLAPGNHTVAVDAVCPSSVEFTHWGGHIQITDVGDAPVQPQATARTATVVNETDIYDKPDGKGKRIGTLEPGEVHPVLEPCRDDWCHIGTIELGGFPGLQNGTAWVYTKGFVTLS